MKPPNHRLLICILAASWLSACIATRLSIACHAGERPAIMDSLYFGTAMPGGSVTIEEWQLFVAEVITPRFPEGLTSWTASGQWQDSAGELQKETSFVLHLVHPDEPGYDAAVAEVRALYKQRFDQEAVLRVRTPGCVSF